MKTRTLLWLLPLFCTLLSHSQDQGTVFEIGQPDRDYQEFGAAGNYGLFGKNFPADAEFTIGQSDAKRDWPFIHPGPMDTWAGSRAHTFKINFPLSEPATGYYRLVVDFVSTHYASPPCLTILINGTELKRRLPRGNSDEPLTNPKTGKPYQMAQLIPPSLLRPGNNTIAISNREGSWAIYDALRLESGVPAPGEVLKVQAQALSSYKRSAEGAKRVVKLQVENLAGPLMPGQLTWKTGSRSGSENFEARFGETELMVAVPEAEQQATVDFSVQAAGKEARASVRLDPARKWRVFIVPTVHTDIGYTDVQDRVMARHASNTRQVLATARKHPEFKWDFETYWQLDAFLREHPEAAQEVFAAIRDKRMSLSGLFGNLLTGLCSHEALNRAMLDARNLASKGNFQVESAILDDVPSAIGSLPTVLAHSGVKYFIEGVNPDRAPHATQGLPSPFYWEGPDGSRVLSHIAIGYAKAAGLITSAQQASETLPGFLASFDRPDYPYDAVLVNGAFSDNQGVAPWIIETVEQWNAEWEFPKLILARPADYFSYIEANFKTNVPVLKADFGGWWEDGAASSACETVLCRRAEERAVTAEMLHSLGSIIGEFDYPKTAMDDLWRNILLYDEHTWGAWCSISEPKSEQTVRQWEVKRSFGLKADTISRELLDSGMGKLARLAPKSDLVVFNQLSWPRQDIVVTKQMEAVQDIASGAVIPCQPLPEGGSCFIARGLPSIGYRTYKEVSAKKSRPAVVMTDDGMENEFYRIQLDRATGALRSIYDKEAKRELIDVESAYGLGELIYVSGGEGTHAVHSDLRLPAPKFTYHRQKASGLKKVNGPVFGELTTQATAERFPGITLRVRLYKGLKRLDLSYELDKEETTAKEAVYVAFPFVMDVSKGGLWLEQPNAILEPLKDQHSSACRDWYPVQRWLAASDGITTVVLSPLDNPLFTLGGMTASTWPRALSLKRAHMFAYLMNNYWHTNYKAQQGGRHTFRFSLTSHNGPLLKETALMNGWEMFCPPAAAGGDASHKPTLTSSARSLVRSSLPLVALKRAEDNNQFMFRFCDFAGAGGKLSMDLPRPITQAAMFNLVENDAQAVRARKDSIQVPIKPFSPVTMGVQFKH